MRYDDAFISIIRNVLQKNSYDSLRILPDSALIAVIFFRGLQK